MMTDGRWGSGSSRSRNEYLKNNPSHAGMFIGDDEEAELDVVGTKNDDGTAIQIFDVEITWRLIIDLMLKFDQFT